MLKYSRIKLYTLLLLILVLVDTHSLYAQTSEPSVPLVYRFELKEDIMPKAWRTTKRAIEEAHELNADYILLVLNTYGGMVNMADSIRTKLLSADATTIVYIENNAASAGALISLACDSIYMQDFATIGAATVVTQDGSAAPDKYQSYFRRRMQATAEAKGLKEVSRNGKVLHRHIKNYQFDEKYLYIDDTIKLDRAGLDIVYKRNPEIAKGMVDQDIFIKGITDTGKVITFTAQEARIYGYCDKIVDSPEAALAAAGLKDYTLKSYKPTALDKIIGYLSNPALSSILILLMIGGIYFELQTPGVGFPIIASVFAAVLYFAPLYLDGLAANWEILIFIVGMLLVMLEIFVIPGFGITGIAGIILILMGLTFSAVYNEAFDFSFEGGGTVTRVFLRIIVTVTAAIGAMIYFGTKVFDSDRVFKRVALTKEQRKEDGYGSEIYGKEEVIIGQTGVAVTDLRPAGKIDIGDERFDATTEGGYILKGSKVLVHEIRNNHLLVRKV